MNKNHVVKSKVKIIVCTLTLCIDVSETCLCLTHNFVMYVVFFFNNTAQLIVMIRERVSNKNYVPGSKVKVIDHT